MPTQLPRRRRTLQRGAARPNLITIIAILLIAGGLVRLLWPSPEQPAAVPLVVDDEGGTTPDHSSPEAVVHKAETEASEYAAIPIPISISPEMAEVPAIPAEPGSLAGCNVLLVTLDTTRADRLGCYGNANIETPNLDRLAGEGVIFSKAVAAAPTTLPSHSSILTGLYPVHHGVRANGVFHLDDEQVTLAEEMRDAGYNTAAVISAFVLDSQFGLAQGFATYDDDLSQYEQTGQNEYKERPAEKTTDRAITWLRESAGERFFLWVHYFDAHAAYEPPRPYSEQYADRLYEGEIAYVDASLGRLLGELDELGVTDNTLVVVASDHGEGLGQHGELVHGYLVYESTIHVPLIVRCGARVGGGAHVASRVSLVDIAPTVASLLGLKGIGATDGVDLTQPASADRVIYTETLHGLVELSWAALAGVYAGQYKYIESPNPELFDLSTDPDETHNLFAERADLAATLRGHLADLFGDDMALAATARPDVNVSDEALKRLAALGYAGAPGDISEDKPRLDPKLAIKDAQRAFDRVMTADNPALVLGERLARLKKVTEEFPDYELGWKRLGHVYRDSGDLANAEMALTRCLELRPGAPLAMYDLAVLRSMLGDSAGGIELLEEALEKYPDYLEARYTLGVAYFAEKRTEEAADQFAHAFALDATHKQCAEYVYQSFTAAGRGEELTPLFHAYLDEHPATPAVRVALAKHLVAQQQFADAAAVLREGVSLSPEDREIVSTLALLLVACPDESIRNEEEAVELIDSFCSGPGERDAMARLTLTLVFSRVGRLEDATHAAETARALAATEGNAALVQAAERLLEQLRSATGAPATQPDQP